jgi:ribulose 1,5-bisphosphate synthetase/thiazole synthase
MIAGALPVDPLTLTAKAVVDATGHEAAVVETLRLRGLLESSRVPPRLGDDATDALAGERFMLERVAKVFRTFGLRE